MLQLGVCTCRADSTLEAGGLRQSWSKEKGWRDEEGRMVGGDGRVLRDVMSFEGAGSKSTYDVDFEIEREKAR